MSVRREDEDAAERWWKSLFCHGQRLATHNFYKETALKILRPTRDLREVMITLLLLVTDMVR